MMIMPARAAAAAVFFVCATLPAAAQQLAPGTYDFATHRSLAVLTVSGALGNVRADLPVSGGQLQVGRDGRILDARATLSADGLSTRSGTARRQLRGANGFDVQRHPSVRFNATRVRHRGEQLLVDGDLTVKGITRPVSFDGRIVRSNRRRIVAVLEGQIDRTAFGVTAGRPLYGRTANVRLRMVARKARR